LKRPKDDGLPIVALDGDNQNLLEQISRFTPKPELDQGVGEIRAHRQLLARTCDHPVPIQRTLEKRSGFGIVSRLRRESSKHVQTDRRSLEIPILLRQQETLPAHGRCFREISLPVKADGQPEQCSRFLLGIADLVSQRGAFARPTLDVAEVAIRFRQTAGHAHRPGPYGIWNRTRLTQDSAELGACLGKMTTRSPNGCQARNDPH
jgi:hypothetical protein